MFTISRFEQRIRYFWTGSNWSTKATDAKRFDSGTEARNEMTVKKIQYAYNVLPDTSNSKERSELIFNAAVSAVQAAGGHEVIDQLPAGQPRHQAYEVLYQQVMTATGCVRETAKRNVAKALRRARYGEIIRRGGLREPAGGRPPKQE